MLHDVTVVFFKPGFGDDRQVFRVDAESGDDAVSQASVKAQAVGDTFRIVSVVPAGNDALDAAQEGEDAPEEPEAEPARRGRKA